MLRTKLQINRMTNLDDLLDERETGGSDFPDTWKPDEEDESIEGVVTNRQISPFADHEDEDPDEILHVRGEEKEWATNTNTALVSLVKDNDVREGDYVRIRYVGEEKSSSGYKFKDYRLAVVRSDELDDVDVPETDGGVAVTEAATPTTPEIPDEAIEFVESLIDFHGEMSEEELNRYLNDTHDYDLSAQQVVEETGYTLQNGVIR